MKESERRKALGNWGENKAISLLKAAGFSDVRDMNAEISNHPFGDIYAERSGARYLIGVKTRNKYQVSGLINPTYNVRKKGADVQILAARYKAELAWVAIPVVPEEQKFSAYFGTIKQIEENAERFSIPTKPEKTRRYECLGNEEIDRSIRPEWSNGGYAAVVPTVTVFPKTPRQAGKGGANPIETLRSFFASIPDDARALLILCCARQMDSSVGFFNEVTQADHWLKTFLDSASEPNAMLHFGKVIWMIAVLDFELSPSALSRLVALHQHTINQEGLSPDRAGQPSRLEEMSREMLRDKVPQLKKQNDAWRDVRMHELDEASLWIYRDEMRQRNMEDLGKQIDQLRS
jgi:Holliday junction resolvase